MREGRYDAGFAFDGDGDRVLAVDRDGESSSTATS
jgi:phosphomannomutase